MDLTTGIQGKMFQEIQKRDLFDQALKYSNSYLDTAFERNIFPLDEAIDQLSFFEESNFFVYFLNASKSSLCSLLFIQIIFNLFVFFYFC